MIREGICTAACIAQPMSIATARPVTPNLSLKISRYKIIIPFETRLMIAGILNSPKDCKIPTKENASPVKIIIGNRMFDK